MELSIKIRSVIISNMDVIYSIAANFAGGGIGTTSYNAVSGIDRHKFLKKLYCVTYQESEIADDLIQKYPTAFLDRVSFLPQNKRYLAKDSLFDFFVSRNDLTCDIFHGWNGHCLRSLKKAKMNGAITFLERASSHINTYEKLVSEEYRKWGIKSDVISNYSKKRLIEEYNTSDFINIPSEFAYKSMVENGIPKEKLNKLPFGVNTSKFKAKSEKRKENLEYMVLFVGQVGFRKGIPYLLEAWQSLKLKNARLYLVGGEEEAAKEYLRDFRSDPTIEFVGFTNPLSYYQAADIFVFPSIEEGSALVNYEALACGLPVITTFNSGSVVEDGKSGFIIPEADIASISEKINYFYEHPRKEAEFSLSARKLAEEFTWKNYGERLVDVYLKKLKS